MLNKISRASLILGAFAQHQFGGALGRAMAAVRAERGAMPTLSKQRGAGSKPAGARGMHLTKDNRGSFGFRPMAHGKIGKRSKGLNGCQKRVRNRALSAALSLDRQYGNRRAYSAPMSKG
jgi:hypothetical protein